MASGLDAEAARNAHARCGDYTGKRRGSAGIQPLALVSQLAVEGLAEWREHIDADMQCLSRSPSDRLIFVTPIICIRIIDVHDDIAIEMREIVAGFKRDLRSCLASSGRIKRGTRWTGAIEWDLLHPNFLGGRRKRELAEALGVDFDALTLKQRVLITHCHIVIDTRGHLSSSAVMTAIAQQWPGPYRVVSRALHADKTVPENLERLASYCTKFRMRYSQAWLGTRTEYGPDFEPEWRDALVRLITSVGLEAMTVSNVVSRAGGTASKCTRVAPETVVSQQFPSGLEASQLMMVGEAHNATTSDTMQNLHQTSIARILTERRHSTSHYALLLAVQSRDYNCSSFPEARPHAMHSITPHARHSLKGYCIERPPKDSLLA